MARKHLQSVGSLFSEEKITDMFTKIKDELETERDKEINKIKERYQQQIDKLYGQLKGALVEIHLPEFMVKKGKGNGGSRIPFTPEEDTVIMDTITSNKSIPNLQGILRSNGFPERTAGSIRSHIDKLNKGKEKGKGKETVVKKK